MSTGPGQNEISVQLWWFFQVQFVVIYSQSTIAGGVYDIELLHTHQSLSITRSETVSYETHKSILRGSALPMPCEYSNFNFSPMPSQVVAEVKKTIRRGRMEGGGGGGGGGGRGQDVEDNVACPAHPALPSAPVAPLLHQTEILATRI